MSQLYFNKFFSNHPVKRDKFFLLQLTRKLRRSSSKIMLMFFFFFHLPPSTWEVA